MANSVKDIALLDAYLNGQLDGQEQQSVELRLKTDPEFAELAADLDVLVQGVRQQYRQQIKSDLQALERILPPLTLAPQEKNESRLTRWINRLFGKSSLAFPAGSMRTSWVISLAILVGVVICVWLFAFRQSPEEKLFAAYFEPTKMEQTRARTVKTKEQLNAEATAAFNGERFKKAIPLLKELFETHQDTTRLYFLGLAQLGTGQIDEAIQSLMLYNRTYEDVRYQKINYNIGLAHLRAGRYDLAIAFLEQDTSQRSEQLIEEIRRLQNSSK